MMLKMWKDTLYRVALYGRSSSDLLISIKDIIHSIDYSSYIQIESKILAFSYFNKTILTILLLTGKYWTEQEG